VPRGPSQGEALVTWALWGLIALCVIATYSRIDPSETYHVSREGITGGLSRALTLVNFPFGQSRHIATSLATTSRTGKSIRIRTNRHSGWHLSPPGSLGVSDSVKVGPTY